MVCRLLEDEEKDKHEAKLVLRDAVSDVMKCLVHAFSLTASAGFV